MDRRRIGTAIADTDANQQVLSLDFGVFHNYVEIAALVEYSGVNELVLRFELCSADGSPRAADRMGTRPEDTCRGTSCTSGSACYPDKSNIP